MQDNRRVFAILAEKMGNMAFCTIKSEKIFDADAQL
jgi:hypothetical protein